MTDLGCAQCKTGEDVCHPHRAEVRIVDSYDGPARRDLWVLEHRLDRFQRSHGNPGFVQYAQGFLTVALKAPLGESLIEFVGMGHAVGVRRKARVVDEFLAAQYAQSRTATLCVLVDKASQSPSRHRYAPRGAVSGRLLPVRWWRVWFWSNSTICNSMSFKTAS